MRKAEIIRKKQHRRKGRRYYLTIFPMHIKTGESIINISIVPKDFSFTIKAYSSLGKYIEGDYYYV